MSNLTSAAQSGQTQKVVVMETIGAESRTTMAFTRGNVLEPYPAECIAGAAEAAGFEAVVLQRGSLSDEEVLDFIVKHQPVCVGMTVFTYSLSIAQRLATMIKAKLPQTLVVVGGYHPSLVPSCVSYTDFDFAVIGEGEITFTELLQKALNNEPMDSVRGIAYMKDGEVIVNAPRERVKDLDTLPKPKRMREYLERARMFNLSYPDPDHQIAAEIGCSRGCVGRCTFCVSNVMRDDRHGIQAPCEMSVSLRSPQSVAQEIRQLHEEFGVNLLYLTDLTFNYNKERVKAICQALINEGLHDADTEMDPDHVRKSVHWYALVKVGLDQETAQLMAKAGCAKIGTGIESFFEAKAKQYAKPHREIGIVRRSLEAADNAGIINRCLLVFGSPNETWDTVRETIEGLKRFPIDQVRIAFLTPFPGTQIVGEVEDSIADRNFDHYDTDHPVMTSNLSPEELVEARKMIGREFYGSREYADRCRNKIARFPWLKESYRWWFEDLYQRGIADLRWIAE